MNSPSKASIEAEIANAIVRFQREQQGRGAADVRAHIVGDLVKALSRTDNSVSQLRVATMKG